MTELSSVSVDSTVVGLTYQTEAISAIIILSVVQNTVNRLLHLLLLLYSVHCTCSSQLNVIKLKPFSL